MNWGLRCGDFAIVEQQQISSGYVSKRNLLVEKSKRQYKFHTGALKKETSTIIFLKFKNVE